MKYIIVGGLAGGATAAARLRRNDEFADILLLEKGRDVSYAGCGTPYYIGGVIANESTLHVASPRYFKERYHIDVRTESEVVSVDADRKVVRIHPAQGEDYEESYDKLLLSTGAEAVLPSIKGVDLPGVFTFHSLEDALSVKRFMEQSACKEAVVVGSGFIGLELVENLRLAGWKVTLVESKNRVLPAMDVEFSVRVRKELEAHEVKVYTGVTVQEISSSEQTLEARLSSGDILRMGMVMLCVGVRPNVKLAKNAGLEIGDLGGIRVNAFMQTSNEDIYAVGDAVETMGPFARFCLPMLAGPANYYARIAADNMCGGNQRRAYPLCTSIVKVFDLQVAKTGWTEKELTEARIHYHSATVHSFQHVGFYPGAKMLTLKVLFATDGELFGAEAVGAEGVDKRIDQISAVLKHSEASVEDLIELEPCYAPPFGSPKDPVVLAGYVADNILRKKMLPLYWQDLLSEKRKEAMLIDVRTKMEYAAGHLKGAVNIPVDELDNAVFELPEGKPVWVYCRVGMRGYVAVRKLMQLWSDREIRNLVGGYLTCKDLVE